MTTGSPPLSGGTLIALSVCCDSHTKPSRIKRDTGMTARRDFMGLGRRLLQRILFTLLFLAVLTGGAHEALASKSTEINRREVSHGKRRFTLIESKNEIGQYEVRVILHEDRFLAPTTDRLILIGKAIDVPDEIAREPGKPVPMNPRRVTTWFIPKSFEISEPIRFYQIGDDPWPTALTVIKSHLNTDSRWYSHVAAESLAPYLSMAVSQSHEFFEEIKQEQMQLFELEIRIKNLEIGNPKDPIIPYAKQLIANGWKSIHDRIEEQQGQTIYLYAAGDVALAVVGAKLVSIGYKGVSSAVHAIPQTAAGQAIESMYGKLLSGTQEKIASLSRHVSQAPAQIGRSAGYIGVQAALARMSIQEQVKVAISYLQSRSVLGRFALKAASAVFNSARAGVRQLRYVALANGLQITAETLARPQDLFDPDPLVMAKKMASDEDFLQNVAYMTNETFWMAGVSTYLGGNLKKRIAVCAVIGLVNSVTMSFLIKGETNVERVALDTAWESVIGNLQTQIDVTALRYASELSQHPQYQKLRLVGYAVAAVDQGVGYYSYAKITHMLETRLDSRREPTPTPMMTAPEMKLVPIYAPI
jgi:hypothetical protein